MSACGICRSPEGVRLFAVTVDGVPLRVQLYLCDQHGDAYLLRMGETIGQFLRESGDSVPAAAAADAPETRRSDARAEREPPVLNKSGGSDVCAKVYGRPCGHDGSDDDK